MTDLALIALLVPLGAFIVFGLWMTIAVLVEDSIGREIGR